MLDQNQSLITHDDLTDQVFRKVMWWFLLLLVGLILERK